jgi:hypothetical protein
MYFGLKIQLDAQHKRRTLQFTLLIRAALEQLSSHNQTTTVKENC